MVKKRSAAYLDYKQYYDSALENYAKQNEVIEGYKEIVDKKEQYEKILENRIKALEEQKDKPLQSKADQEPEKPLHKKERDSIYKMLASVLSELYGQDEVKKGNVKANEVLNDVLAKHGVELDEDTVRKHIKKAAEYLS